MPYTADFAERHALLSKIGSTSFTTEQNLTAYVDVSKYNRVVVVLHAIAVGTTLDLDVEVSESSAGTSAHTLKSITQLTSGDDDVVVVVDIQTAEMTKPSGASGSNYRYLNVELTPDGTCAASVLVFGAEPRFEPVSQTTYEEVVS